MTLREAVARARHDVGKYVSMTARNLGSPPWEPRLREAVARDVLCTDGHRPVWEVWAERRADLAEVANEPEVAEVDRCIAALRARAAELEAPGAPGVDEDLVETVLSLAGSIRALQAKLS